MTARENLERTIKRNRPAWVPMRYDGTLLLLRSSAVSVRPVHGGLDDWGVRWLYTNEEEGSYPDGKPVLSIEDPDSLRVPGTDWEAVTQDMKRQLEALEHQDVLPIAYNELVLFERVQLLLGYENFMIGLLEYREEFQRLVDKVFDYNVRFVRSLLDAGVPGIRFTDDWGMQDRLFISPEDWRYFFKEKYRVLYQMVKDQGGYVFHHSCGRIEQIMEDITELGIDVLDPCQPAANDIFRLKQIYGARLSFMGGLDTQTWLSFGTPGEVYEKTLCVLRVMSKGGGYIAAPSHSITIPEENKKAMLQAVNDYNRTGREGL